MADVVPSKFFRHFAFRVLNDLLGANVLETPIGVTITRLLPSKNTRAVSRISSLQPSTSSFARAVAAESRLHRAIHYFQPCPPHISTFLQYNFAILQEVTNIINIIECNVYHIPCLLKPLQLRFQISCSKSCFMIRRSVFEMLFIRIVKCIALWHLGAGMDEFRFAVNFAIYLSMLTIYRDHLADKLSERGIRLRD